VRGHTTHVIVRREKEQVEAQPNLPGRKAGRYYGPRRWCTRPAHVDTVVDVFPPSACAHCQGPVVATGDVRVQYQADIPPVRPHVTEFRRHVRQCRSAGGA
jgi:hypothetical protein